MEELLRCGKVGETEVNKAKEEAEDTVAINTRNELEKLSALYLGDIKYVN